MVSKLSDPPPTLPPDPPGVIWTAGQPMVRVYHEHPSRDGMAPRTFGPIGRFDPHVRDRRQQPREDPQARGVLYLAADLGTALAEAFPGQWPELAVCPHTRAGWATPELFVPLVDLTAAGALAIGAVGTLAWGDEPRRRTQRWGRRIYEQYQHHHGIQYRSAHQGGTSVALWDRGSPLSRPPGGDRKLWAVWTHVQAALEPQRRKPIRVAPGRCSRCRAYGYAT